VSKAIIVTSIKGGVGKTTVSSSTAYALASKGYKVLAIDMDLGAGGLDIALGCENRISSDITELFSGEISLKDAIVPTPFEGLDFIASPMTRGFKGDIDTERVNEILKEMKSLYDFVIFDMPAGGGEYFEVLASSKHMSLINVITTDGIYAVRAAEKTVYELSEIADEKCSVRMTINGYDLNSPSTNSAGIIDLITTVKAELVGIIPYDGDAEGYLRKGIPLPSVKKSRAGRAAMNIATRICGYNVPVMEGLVPRRRRRKFY